MKLAATTTAVSHAATVMRRIRRRIWVSLLGHSVGGLLCVMHRGALGTGGRWRRAPHGIALAGHDDHSTFHNDAPVLVERREFALVTA